MDNSELPIGLISPRFPRPCFQFLSGDHKQGEEAGGKAHWEAAARGTQHKRSVGKWSAVCFRP